MGQIRVVNRRLDNRHKIADGEIVIAVDRSNKALGNPYVMRSPSPQERSLVIDAYRKEYEKDIKRRGDRFDATLSIAKMLVDGRDVALACWCAPLPCHGEIIMEYATRFAEEMAFMMTMADERFAPGSLSDRAARFAAIAHAKALQYRKFTYEPYISHPIEVAELLLNAGVCDETMVAAGLLHDVVEDTQTDLCSISDAFGGRVAELVSELTKPSGPGYADRQARKTAKQVKAGNISVDAKTIKLADIASNAWSLGRAPLSFASVYISDLQDLLAILEGGNRLLYDLASERVSDAKNTLQLRLAESEALV